ncbi:type II toxin-antitoxin system RelE family toxin [Thermodesulfatator indicus]
MKKKVAIKKGAYKELLDIPKKYQVKILDALRKLEKGKGDIKKLAPKRYRLRVGCYRILFKEEDDLLVVYKIVHRQGADRYYDNV